MVKSLIPSTSLGISEQDVLFAKESIPFLQACVQTPGSRISLEINGKNLILPEALKLVFKSERGADRGAASSNGALR